MDLEEMDRLAYAQNVLPEGLEAAEQRYYLSIRNLYHQYRNGLIDENRALREKGALRRDLQAEQENARMHFAMYCQYQENIRRCQLLKTEITKGARDGMGMDALLERAVCCIAALTHDEVFARLVMERLRERTGKAP